MSGHMDEAVPISWDLFQTILFLSGDQLAFEITVDVTCPYSNTLGFMSFLPESYTIKRFV